MSYCVHWNVEVIDRVKPQNDVRRQTMRSARSVPVLNDIYVFRMVADGLFGRMHGDGPESTR